MNSLSPIFCCKTRREQPQHLDLPVGELLARSGASAQRSHHGRRAAGVEGALARGDGPDRPHQLSGVDIHIDVAPRAGLHRAHHQVCRRGRWSTPARPMPGCAAESLPHNVKPSKSEPADSFRSSSATSGCIARTTASASGSEHASPSTTRSSSRSSTDRIPGGDLVVLGGLASGRSTVWRRCTGPSGGRAFRRPSPPRSASGR